MGQIPRWPDNDYHRKKSSVLLASKIFISRITAYIQRRVAFQRNNFNLEINEPIRISRF
jgi:hypothetical protein